MGVARGYYEEKDFKWVYDMNMENDDVFVESLKMSYCDTVIM